MTRLVEDGVVSMVVVVHVDDIFSIGRKSRYGQFSGDLNQYIPITNLGELQLYAGCQFSRDFDSGTITISQQTVAENMVEKFGTTRTKETPMAVGLRLDDFDPTERDVDEPFRPVIGWIFDVACEPNSFGYPQRVASRGYVFSRTETRALESGLACSHVC